MRGKVSTKMIADASSKILLKTLKSKILLNSVAYTDRLGSYNVLNLSGFKHCRLNHSKTFVAADGHHINGVENFWNQAKRLLRKYNGIVRKNFYLFLKECELRFNYGSSKQQFSQLKKWTNLRPLSMSVPLTKS